MRSRRHWWPGLVRGSRCNEAMVYLLHFQANYKHARHYLGYCKDLTARLAKHASGNGARLTAVVQAAGIGWIVARTWEGDRTLERRLKRQHNSWRLCPVCRAVRKHEREQEALAGDAGQQEQELSEVTR